MTRKTSSVIQIVAFSITALALTCFLIAGLGGRFLGRNWGFHNFGSAYQYGDAAHYTAGSGEVGADGIREIEINWLDGAIDVSTYDGDTIQFTETSHKDLREEAQLHYYNSNGKLILQYQKSGESFAFPFSQKSSLDKKLQLRIPKKMAQVLERFSIDTVSSDTKLVQVTAGSILCDTISGDVSISDCTATNLNFESTSGSFTGSAVVVEDVVEMETTSGSANFSGSVGSVRFETISGDLKLDTDVFPKELKSDSISGSVVLDLPENEGFTCEKETISGDFSSDFALAWKDGEGRYKNGGSELSFETVSGDIIINRK